MLIYFKCMKILNKIFVDNSSRSSYSIFTNEEILMSDLWTVYSSMLAQENIQVIYDSKAVTAKFSFATRNITLPTQTLVNEPISQLFTVHEVGHALFSNYTVEEVTNYSSKYGDLFNVVEDAYIERKLKATFNGIASILSSGYSELLSEKMFGEDIKENISVMNLVDRLNAKAKIGSFIDVPFDKDEYKFVYKLVTLSSNADVIQLCEDIYKFVKENTANKTANAQTDDNSISEEVDGDKEINTNKLENSVDEEVDNSISEEVDELNSEIQENLEKNILDKVQQANICPVIHISLNQNAKEWYDLSEHNKIIVETFKKFVPFKKYSPIVSKIKNVASSADSLFKMKLSANNLKETKRRKTGKINTKSLYNYKTSENIFKTISIQPNQQNHGIILLIDFSGSMRTKIESVILQTAIVSEFCMKNGIPFEIFSFGSLYYNISNSTSIHKIADNTNYKIEVLLVYLKNFKKYMDKTTYNCIYGDTPMLNASCVAYERLKMFKNFGIEKTVLIYITDGAYRDSLVSSNELNLKWFTNNIEAKLFFDGSLAHIKSLEENTSNILFELLLAHIKKTISPDIIFSFISNGCVTSVSELCIESKNYASKFIKNSGITNVEYKKFNNFCVNTEYCDNVMIHLKNDYSKEESIGDEKILEEVGKELIELKTYVKAIIDKIA